MNIEVEKDLILSTDGEVRGRKNLVKEILKLNESDVEFNHGKYYPAIQDGIKKDILWQYSKTEVELNDSNDRNEEPSNSSDKQNDNLRDLSLLTRSHINKTYDLKLLNIPKKTIIEEKKDILNKSTSSMDTETQSQPLDDYSRLDMALNPEQAETDFGYYDYKKCIITPYDSFSFSFPERDRSLQLPDLYLYEYDNKNGNRNTWKSWNYNSVDNLHDSSSEYFFENSYVESKSNLSDNFDYHSNVDIEDISKDGSKDKASVLNKKFSRDSSIHSYNKILPVGKFATQKFHIVQDEEELISYPNICDLYGNPIYNLEYTKEFDSITESVSIDICHLNKVEIKINIVVNKYTRQNQEERPWTKKRIEISRSINLDLQKSGQYDKVEKLIEDVKKSETGCKTYRSSVYRLTSDKLQLSGLAAFKVFQLIMDIAEDSQSTNVLYSDKKKSQFTPKYLLAALQNSNSLLYF